MAKYKEFSILIFSDTNSNLRKESQPKKPDKNDISLQFLLKSMNLNISYLTTNDEYTWIRSAKNPLSDRSYIDYFLHSNIDLDNLEIT